MAARAQAGIPGCAVSTDRCVICERAAGIITCSNIGISCQPQPMLCLRTEAAEGKKPEGDTPPAQPDIVRRLGLELTDGPTSEHDL
jgi:hypothetical protein